MPQLLLESAAAYRKQLQDEVVLLTNTDKQSLLKQEEQLRLLKGGWMNGWIDGLYCVDSVYLRYNNSG